MWSKLVVFINNIGIYYYFNVFNFFFIINKGKYFLINFIIVRNKYFFYFYDECCNKYVNYNLL